jgi:hypothetical protein
MQNYNLAGFFFCMVVKLGRWRWGRNVGGFLRVGCCGGYLVRRGKR